MTKQEVFFHLKSHRSLSLATLYLSFSLTFWPSSVSQECLVCTVVIQVTRAHYSTKNPAFQCFWWRPPTVHQYSWREGGEKAIHFSLEGKKKKEGKEGFFFFSPQASVLGEQDPKEIGIGFHIYNYSLLQPALPTVYTMVHVDATAFD